MIMHFTNTIERLKFLRGKCEEIVPIEAKEDVIDFDSMNKTELIEYALEHGIKIKVKDTKENILNTVKGAIK